MQLRSTYRGLRLVLGDGGESNSMDWLGKYLQMMQVLPGRRRREPVVGSGWDIFTMDAGTVCETDGWKSVSSSFCQSDKESKTFGGWLLWVSSAAAALAVCVPHDPAKSM